MKIDPPDLTAYALGELSPERRREIEAHLATDPQARAFVEESAAFGNLLKEALQNEPVATPPQPETKRKVVRFPFGLNSPGLRLAAMLLLCGAIAALLYQRPAPAPIEEASPALARKEHAAEPPASAPEAVAPPPPDTLTFSGSDSVTVLPQETPLQPALEQALPAASAPARELARSDSKTKPASKLESANAALLSPEQTAKIASGTGEWSEPDARRRLEPTSRTATALPRLLPDSSSFGDQYVKANPNRFENVFQTPLSTFGLDVDTASYTNARRFLRSGNRPPAAAVRVEEFINYFPYAYAPPQPEGEHPFAVHPEVGPCPWQPEHRLVRIGIKGRERPAAERPASNLVFLIDVSGSMSSPDKLPLLLQSMRLLVNTLTENDRVAIVTYAGAAGLVLPSTTGDRKAEILAALDRLQAGGSTNGGQGIELAYQVAASGAIPGGINRVLLASDGDFNVGITNRDALEKLIREKAKENLFLTVLGFGRGNLNDATMERLANHGNGHYAYIDSLREGRKVLVEQGGGTLEAIAKDVKVQVEFNPAQVKSYRLIGYENRIMAAADFNDDQKDSGEIGAGHTVTALYEIIPAHGGRDGRPVDPLKYQSTPTPPPAPDTAASRDLLTLKLRYKEPQGEKSRLLEITLTDPATSLEQSSEDFRFAAAVAAFGLLLAEPQEPVMNWESLRQLAESALSHDPGGYRAEFLDLIETARNTR